MTTVQKLSPAQESTLISALDSAAEFIGGGDDPNTALAKAAAAEDVPEGHLHLLVCAYNTARTHEQLANSTDPMEKSADFALASLDAIRALMYPAEIKTASQIARAQNISDEYLSPPRWYAKLNAPQTTKLAELLVDRVPEVSGPRYDDLPRVQMEKRAAAERTMERMIDSLRTDKAAAEYAVHNTLDDLADYFSKTAEVSYTRARDNVEALFSSATVKVLDFLAAANPEFKKQAMTAAAAVSPERAPYKQLLLAVEQIKTAADAARAYEEAAEAFKLDFPAITDNKKTAGVPDFFALPSVEKSASLTGSALGTAIGITATRETIQQLADNLRGPDPENKIRKNLERLTSPAHEMALNNIRLRTNLQELLTTDPIISAHPPQRVVHIFNELSQLAPRVTAQPAALRSLLRKQLEQEHLEPFEIGEITKLDQSLSRPQGAITVSGGL